MFKRTRGRKPLKLTWNIQKYSSCNYSLGQSIESSRFVVESLGPISWSLLFYPRGYENPNYIACFLQHCGGSHNREIAVDLEMCLKAANGAEHFLKTASNLLFKNRYSLGFPEFLTHEELERCPYPSGTLTLQCYISNNKESNYISDLVSLSNDIKMLYDEKTFYDVLIRVGKTEIKAHTTLLNARAPYMVSLIEQSSYEDSIPFITIVDFSSAIVKEALYFIYTGILTENRFCYTKLRSFALKYHVENLILELTKSTFDECIVSTEINIVSMSHTLSLFHLIADLGHKIFILNVSAFMRGGKMTLQYFVSETDMGDINVDVQITFETKTKGDCIFLFKFKGYLMCDGKFSRECCECATILNFEESVNIRFSHLFRKSVLPSNLKGNESSLYMVCDFSLSDSPKSNRTIPAVVDALTCLSDELHALYTSGIATDLVFVTAVDNKTFKVHKALVCARVPSIMAMFEGDTQAVNGYVHDDLKNLKVGIPSMDSRMFTGVLEYIYTGKVDKKSMEEMLKLQPESVPIYMKAMQEKHLEKLNSILNKKISKSIKFPSER